MSRSRRLPALVLIALIPPAFPWFHPARAAADSAPVVKDPLIQALVGSVDATRLYNRCATMAGCFTRHTWSDSTSTTTGIGVARKWAKAQFDSISAHAGGSLTTSYYDWYQFGTRWSRNVMAVQPASGPYASQIVAVGGHLDSRTVLITQSSQYQPGANDDATGVSTAMECAELMAPYHWERTIQYHNWTGEEEGLLGSEAFCAHAESTGVDFRGYITLDIVGSSQDNSGLVDTTRVRCFADTAAVSRSMQRYMKRIGEAYVPGFQVVVKPKPDRTGRGSDHLSFSDHGYTSIRLIEGKEDLAHQHSAADSLFWLRPTYHARVTRVTLACLANLAQAPVTPAGVAVATTSGGHLRVTWTANTETDLAGYLVGWHGPDPALALDDSSIVGGDALTMTDVGLVTEHILVGPAAGDSIYIAVAARDTGGHESIASREIGAIMPLATGVPGRVPGGTVAMFGLGDPRPNPASGSLELWMSSSSAGLRGDVSVFDAGGRRVRELVRGEFAAGTHAVSWNLRDEAGARVPAGVYLIRLVAAGETISRKVVVTP